MRYMLLIYLDEQALSEAERQECYEESTQLTHELEASGQYLAAAPLYPTSTATSVRVREGKRLVTDGPFAETKEALLGFYTVDFETLDEAIAFSKELSAVNPGSTSYEIRPFYTFRPGEIAS